MEDYKARHGTAIDPRTGLPITSPTDSPGPSQSPYAGSPGIVQQGYSSPTSPQPVQQQYSYPQGQQPYGYSNGGGYQQQQQGGGFMMPVPKTTEPQVQSTELAGVHSSPNSNHVPPPIRSEKIFPVPVKSWKHIFSSPTLYRWTFVHHYQKPGWVYQDNQTYRHRDFAGRVMARPKSDRYLHHKDGRLRNLIVQCTDDIFESPGNGTWQRTYIRKVSPLKARTATWVIDFSYDPESWNDWWVMVARAFPAAIAMSLCFWELTTARSENNGWYMPVPYTFHGDAKVWGNRLENHRLETSELATNHQIYHVLKPRHLCFLNNPESDQPYGVSVREVSEWEFSERSEKGQHTNLDYLFVAFSGEQFPNNSPEEMMALIQMAEHACREAKLPAFWISSHCMVDTDENEVDVYRIADILRGAQKMVIVVGPAASSGLTDDTDTLLQQWGSRMWTFPEVLLCPGHSIKVYNRARSNSPLTVTKNQFAGRVWTHTDAEVSSQLLDHYNGSLSLSRLELAVLLLKCLFARDTKTWFLGDQSYALMGLLRLRPQIDRTDSPFQAFARISLANDSDGLLERAISVLPVAPATQPFHDFSDAYQSELWDITPTCQVAAICDNDTVLIDGVHGASIRWKSFYYPNYSTGASWRRWAATKLMEYQFILFCVGIGLAASRQVAPGVILILIYAGLWLWTPNLVRLSLGGKLTYVPAALFGFEGYLNAPTVERAIFGGNFDRLAWSTNGSPLCRSTVNEFGERVGTDPYLADMGVREKVESAKAGRAVPGQMRVFTLVDTYNMQMTLFEAARPPVAVFLCGAEGGMQRAVGCSYDFTSQTMYRETVLRMPTTSLNRMERVPRFRFGLRRPEELFTVRQALPNELV